VQSHHCHLNNVSDKILNLITYEQCFSIQQEQGLCKPFQFSYHTVFAALNKEPNEFVQEMRTAAAVKWYELEKISQEKAAEIAGLTQSEFIHALSRHKISPIQYTAEPSKLKLTRSLQYKYCNLF
jgi:predicted HTH domain antitoxin